jgi:arylsulfatase A-like enzyme
MKNERPNILFILTDQYRFDCFSRLNHPVVKTPNLDKLASDGVFFSSAYCGTMACGPARASIFTGYYMDTHKMRSNSDHLKPENFPALPEYIRDAGYDTALIGKLHLHPFQRDYGFRHFKRHDAPYTNYLEEEAHDSAYIKFLQQTMFKDDPGLPIKLFTEDEAALDSDEQRFMKGSCFVDEEHHETPWVTREAIEYLRNGREKDKPFFLNVSYFGPHQPYLCPGKWGKMYDPDQIPLPDDFFAETGDKLIFKESFHGKRVEKRAKEEWDENTYRKILSAYYGHISMIDHYIGVLLDYLKENGLYENTLIIFSADHGEFGGQFKAFYKGLPYEGSTHIPMIVRDPRSKCNDGRIEDSCVNNLDIFATCIKAAQGSVPEDTESRDMFPVIDKQYDHWENRTFYKKDLDAHIVRGNFKLIRGEIDNETVYEFYDLNKRPLEAENLIEAPEYADMISEMKKELDSWFEEQETPIKY